METSITGFWQLDLELIQTVHDWGGNVLLLSFSIRVAHSKSDLIVHFHKVGRGFTLFLSHNRYETIWK